MHERFFSSHEFSYEKCSEIFPEIFEPLFCGSEKIPGKFPPNFPLNFPNFPAKNQKKIHRRASAGSQGEELWGLREVPSGPLVAPYCAIPRDYLSDTPLLRTMGFLVSQHGQLCAIPPPPFLSVSPLESIREVEVRYRPPSKGYLSDTCAIPYENKGMGAIPPSAILSRKGIARYGGYLALGRQERAILATNG